MALQLEPNTGVQRHTITFAEYDRMVEAGVFEPEARLELICGELIDIPLFSMAHESIVARLHHYTLAQLRRQATLWPQFNSVRLADSNSQPRPSMTLLHWRDDFYRGQYPEPDDVILLVQVADSTLPFVQGAKLQLYAEAGIPEYWVVNLVDWVIEVYTAPTGGRYQAVRVARRGDTLPLPGGLSGALAVLDILGPAEQDEGGADAR